MAGENTVITVRQRARNDRSGKATAALMHGGNPDTQPEPQPVRRGNKKPQKDNYRSASEFYAGPSQPGKVHGIRRNEAAERDSVAFLLTDEGLMTDANGVQRGGGPRAGGRYGAGGAGPYSSGNKVPKIPTAERNNIDHACFPTQPEPQWRSGVRVTHPEMGMDAPYFEDLDPKPPREETPVTGKRHVRQPQRQQSIFIDPSRPLTDDEKRESHPMSNRKSTKSNQSVNVLCLNTYSAEELHEPRPTYRPLGARKWTAPDMPPARHPVIAPIKTHAKDEHDVLGTGRWGKAEEPRPQGVAKGECRPRRDTANLFAGDRNQVRRRNWVPPNEVRKQTATQKKYGGQPNLLKYYDPSLDGPQPQPAPRPHGNRANEESKVNQEPAPFRPSRAPGVYSKNSNESGKSLW